MRRFSLLTRFAVVSSVLVVLLGVVLGVVLRNVLRDRTLEDARRRR